MSWLDTLFSSERFMPHGPFYLWDPRVVWLHVISDALIAGAYITIPVTLLVVARKRKDLPFDWMFACFGVFILACGTTHLLEVWTLWHPIYWFSGLVKAITAAASIATAILLVRLIPQLLAIPSPRSLREANAALSLEIAEHRRSQQERDRLVAILETTPDLVGISDPAGRLLYLNQAARALLGVDLKEDITACAIADFIPDPAHHPILREGLPAAARDGAWSGETVLLSREAAEITVSQVILAHKNAAREVESFSTVMRDITERKQAEKAVRDNLEEFCNLAEAMPQIVWIARPDGGNIYFNQQWADYTGLTLEESVGSGWNQPFHPDEQQIAWDAWAHATATLSMYSIESRLRRADGIYRWWLIRGVPQQDGAGNILKWFGTCTDIHDLKLAELEVSRINRELIETEAKYRSIFENSHEGVFQNTPDGRFISANPALARMLGFASPAELMGARTANAGQGFCDPEQRRDFQRILEEKGRVEGFEYEVCRQDSQRIWVSESTHIVRDAEGRALYYEGSIRDVTARKEAEESLRLLNSAVMQAKESILITDADLDAPGPRILFANSAFTSMTGYSSEEVLGKTPRILQGPRTDESVLRRLRRNLEAGEVFEGEAINYRKDGTEYHQEWQIAPLRDERNKITHFVAHQRDITDRKRAEARVVELNRELVKLSRQAGMAEIATGVLHNVGNVLNSASVSLEVMAAKVSHLSAAGLARVAALLREHAADLPAFLTEDAQGRQLHLFLSRFAEHLDGEQSAVSTELKSLRLHVDHISEIVSRQQNYATSFAMVETLALHSLIEDAISMNQPALESEAFQIVRDFDATIPPLSIDRHKLMQIMVNLLRNARHALAESGKTDRQLTVRTKLGTDARLKITVADSGVGIPAENLARIFEHGFTTRKAGHGFGLHSSALTAREMGGSLSVTSAGAGLGASFTLDVPCGTAPAEESLIK